MVETSGGSMMVLKQNVKNPVVLLPGIHNLWENDHVESIQEGVHEGK